MDEAKLRQSPTANTASARGKCGICGGAHADADCPPVAVLPSREQGIDDGAHYMGRVRRMMGPEAGWREL